MLIVCTPHIALPPPTRSGLTTQPYILDPEAGFPATYDSGSYHGADETERLREELQALKQAFVSKYVANAVPCSL